MLTPKIPAKPVCFLTMDDLEGYFTYDQLSADLLRSRGWDVQFVSWRASVDWNDFEAVIIRSPWDYQTDPQGFLAVLEVINNSSALLLNSLEVVRWNLRKTYLLELEKKGVPIIPTIYGEGLVPEDFARIADAFNATEIVIKPIVGANAEGAFRLNAPFSCAKSQAALLHYANAPYLAQPFLKSIIIEGEISLIYTLGEFSHAIIKRPKQGDFRVQEEHGGLFEWYLPEAEAFEASTKALEAVPGYSAETPLLYARVDLARCPDGTLGLMELELIEPSLYLDLHESSPLNFANAIERALSQV